MELRNHQAKLSKRVHKRLYGIIAGLVLVLAVSMAGTFASSLVAIESAKDTVISSDGAFVDKKTGALVSTENPHITTKVFNLVQALEGLLSSETNAALPGQKGIVARARHLGAWCTPCIVAHFCDGLGRPTSEIKNAASRLGWLRHSMCRQTGAFVECRNSPPLCGVATFAVFCLQGDDAEKAAKLTPTNNATIATKEVLVSPKGELIAVAPLTNDQGSLLSACAMPCNPNPFPPPPLNIRSQA